MALQSFAEGLWLADGPVLQIAGFGYPTRMAVMSLPAGGLFVWSPVALTPALRQAVGALRPSRPFRASFVWPSPGGRRRAGRCAASSTGRWSGW